jgi:hypothetical protein
MQMQLPCLLFHRNSHRITCHTAAGRKAVAMIGGDQRIAELRVSGIRSSGKSSLFPHQRMPREEMLSLGSAALVLTKAAIACDAFNFAYVIETGVVQSAIACLVILLLTQGSYAVLLRSWSVGESYTMADVWRHSIGSKTAWIPNCILLYAYFTCLTAEYWEITEGVQTVVEWLWPDAVAVTQDYSFVQYVAMVLGLISLLFTTRIRGYVAFASVGLFSAVVGLVCAVIYFNRHMFDEVGYLATSEIVLFRLDFDSIYAGLREMSTAMFAHPFLALIANEMYKPSRKRLIKMVWMAMVPTALFVYVTPLFGYLLMTDVEDDYNFLRVLDATDSPEVIVGQIGVLLLSITSLWFYMFFVANTFVTFFSGERLGTNEERQSSSSAPLTRLVSGFVASLFAISINFTTEVVELIIYEVAAMAYSLIGFVLPAFYYLAQFKFRVLYWGVMSVVILFLGGFLSIMTIAGMVNQLRSYYA